MQTLRNARRAKGLTQKELSEISGITEVTINALEAGRTRPNFNTLTNLENVVGAVNWRKTTGKR